MNISNIRRRLDKLVTSSMALEYPGCMKSWTDEELLESLSSIMSKVRTHGTLPSETTYMTIAELEAERAKLDAEPVQRNPDGSRVCPDDCPRKDRCPRGIKWKK